MGLLLRECFTVSREAFYQDLRPKYILPRLIVDEIITYEEQNMILEKGSTKVQVHELMRILFEKNDPKVFDSFVAALKEDDAYFWLADILIDKKKKLGYNDNNFNLPYHLAAGGVPLQTDYLLERTDLLEKVRIHLKEAAGKRRWWLVLHGMIGCGKSVIAAEAIRNENLFQEYFKDGVCWIPVGNLKNETAVFLKLQCLWEKLNPNQIFPWTNQEVVSSRREELTKVTRALRTAFTKSNKNFLLVLDDVWDDTVIQAFDIDCTTLVTTTNKGVVDSVKGFCSYVPFNDGLSLDEARKFLSLYVDVMPSELPIEVEAIHHKCKGLPLVLSLIGGNMSQYGNQIDRWRYWKKEFDKGITGALERKRHFSGGLSYLNSTMKLIFDMLPKDVKDYYLDFAIFEEDVFVPNKVLELLWDLDRFAVEDIMMELYKRSLVCLEDHERNCYMYSIHDVYLKFLKSESADDRLMNCHKKLINAYLKVCKKNDGTYDYSLLPNDGYIYNFIGYHLAAAHEEALFPKIFLDLKFLENKVRLSAPGDVLYDFETYRSYFDNDYKEKEDMVAFIRRNAHVICRPDSDIIQLALFEPSNRTVHQRAKESVAVKPVRGKIYYEWCNQENVPYRSLLNVNMNFEDLTCVTFSPNNNVVVAVGSSKEIQVWESASGKVLETLSGHTDSINCCTFNLIGTLLATASADKTVKLWKINHTNYVSGKRSSKSSINVLFMKQHIENLDQNDTSLLTFKNHESEVLWCSFSPENNVVSSDRTGDVYIWEPETGKSLCKFCHSREQLSHNVVRCYFVPNSQYVATAANEVIKLWNFNTRTCSKLFTHKSRVADFCFSENPKYIYSVSGFTVGRWSFDGQYHEVCSSKENCLYLCCCLSPDEQFIAVGTSECFIIVWNVTTKKIIANLKGHKNPVVKVEFSRFGSKLLSASNDGHVTIWDISDCKATSMVSLENNLSVRQVDELTVASSDQLNRIQVRVKTDGNLKFKSNSDESDITTCSMSYNCSEVVYGTKSGSVKVFNLNTEKTEFCFSHKKRVTYIVHIKNSQFVSCSEDTTLKIWNDKINLVGHSDSVVMCVPYNDGTRILSCSEDGTIIAWNLKITSDVMKLSGHGNQKVNFCDVSADGKFFCSASSDCTIKIWNAEHGQLMHTLDCEDCVRCCRFSPTEKILLSGEDSGEVLVWEYGDNWIQSSSLEYVDGWVKDIKFSEDGSQVLVVGESIKLWTWRFGTWTHAQTFILPGAFSCAVWASPDFKILVFVHNSILYILKTVL